VSSVTTGSASRSQLALQTSGRHFPYVAVGAQDPAFRSPGAALQPAVSSAPKTPAELSPIREKAVDWRRHAGPKKRRLVRWWHNRQVVAQLRLTCPTAANPSQPPWDRSAAAGTQTRSPITSPGVRPGVSLPRCGSCRGRWLRRGWLDLLVPRRGCRRQQGRPSLPGVRTRPRRVRRGRGAAVSRTRRR
jgi:hypothetical protein